MKNNQEPEVNLEQILESVRGFFGKARLGGGGGAGITVLVGILLVGLVVWVGSGIYTVATVGGEVAVLRMFGKYTGETGAGLHWFWPSPIGKKDIVQVDERRRLELGFRGTVPALQESLMITGDENIVDVQLLLQYNVKPGGAKDFLFMVVDPDGVTLRDVAETSLRQVVGSRPIDDVLTDKKEEVQSETKILIQRLLDSYVTGINITEVKLQNVNPPSQVQAAFDDVVKAKEDKERIINLADAYKEEILPTAEGEAARLRESAEAFRAERVNISTGQAQRFTAILSEYRKSPEVTRQRLYIEAMEKVLPGITKILGDPGQVVILTEGSKDVVPIPPSNPGISE
jgi:membrane protease subunit HflK